MILLTIYHSPAGMREKREFLRLQDAIAYGQKSGRDYDVYDPATGKRIDYNEINVREEPAEEWYYDEAELLWKRVARTDDHDEPCTPSPRFAMFGQSRNLRRVGS